MIIDLEPNWFLDCDTTNVVLTERRVIIAKPDGAKGIAPKPENIGKTRDVQHGFYGSIAQACQGYMNKGVASLEGMLTAAQIVAAWDEAAARVEKACRDIPRTKPAPEEPKLEAQKQRIIQTPDGPLTLPQKSPEPLYTLPQA